MAGAAVIRRRQALWLSALGIGALLFAGCSSTLDEYRCTAAAECIDDEGQGICHSSGYCAFVDFDECDGYRFGKHSGEQSGQCVGADDDVDASISEDAALADAGPSGPDAQRFDADVSIPKPTANIAAVNLACDRTALDLDGSASQSFGGTTLVNYRWTLRAPNNAQISELSGAPGSGFRPIRGFVSGNVAQPRVNLTPYLDKSAIKIVTEDALSVIRNNNLAIEAGDRTFSFAIATPELGDVGEVVEVHVTRGTGIDSEILASEAVTLSSSINRHSVDFTLADNITNGSIRIRSSTGRYYLDNFRIHADGPGGSTEAELVQNPSFEQGFAPWVISVQLGAGASATSASIPQSLKAYGNYKLELVVSDSNGSDSTPASVEIGHAACPAPPP